MYIGFSIHFNMEHILIYYIFIVCSNDKTLSSSSFNWKVSIWLSQMERLLVFFDYFANERLYPTSHCPQNKKNSVITLVFHSLHYSEVKRQLYAWSNVLAIHFKKFVIFLEYQYPHRFLKHFANSIIDPLF